MSDTSSPDDSNRPDRDRGAVPGFFERVYEVVRLVPSGQVATYGQIAAIVSHRGAARTVGWALHSLPPGSDVPWHRVINARGQISLHPGARQIALLRKEGVAIDDRRQVDMKRFQWPGLDWPEIEALRHNWHTRASAPNQKTEVDP
jgi:methylated-DNA-protein-cysteine methyltransferase-like protein